jgi:alpha-D-xyloside xylohydrolase
MKPLKLSFAAIAILLLSLIYASGKSTEVQISTVGDSEFPIIHIANPSGKDVNIQPISSTEGSIGFKKDGEVNWITGKSSLMVGEAGETFHLWKIDSLTLVKLQVDAKTDEIDFNFTLETKDQSVAKQWFININATQDEYFTGIFERVVDGHQNNSWTKGIQTALNLRGERVEMKLKPTVSAYAPFYLSSNNYGLFVKGTWPGIFDFCKEIENTVQVSFEGSALAFKIYIGSQPKEIVQKHALETGPSIIPPEWAFGPWRWRDEHFNNRKYYDSTEVKAPFNSALVEDILMMKAYDIPCTAYWIDRPWATGTRGFDDYEFDPARFPQREEMIKWLNEKDIKLMIWIAPFVMGNMADYAEESGYYLQSRGWRNARQVLMDFSNPEAVKWWGENGPGKLARMGIKGYKLDRADGEKLMDSDSLKTYNGTTYRENYNNYPHQYVKAAYDAVKVVLGDDFILFPRAQYTGSARYGGMWAGDTNGRPEGLRSAIIGMQRCAIMGYPVWGSDTGGYWGDFSHETCMHWLGFSCFSPLMEVGPTNNHGFWDNPDEPHYDAELLATWRLYAKIRMKLIPYLHSLAKEANSTGMPIARPLFLVYPDQKEAWINWQTYLLGPDILVSAIWQSGTEKHKLYLPAGEKWIDAWEKDRIYQGGQYIEVAAPKYKIPIFIRKGATIDLGNLNELYQKSLKIASQKPDLAELEKAEGWR